MGAVLVMLWWLSVDPKASQSKEAFTLSMARRRHMQQRTSCVSSHHMGKLQCLRTTHTAFDSAVGNCWQALATLSSNDGHGNAVAPAGCWKHDTFTLGKGKSVSKVLASVLSCFPPIRLYSTPHAGAQQVIHLYQNEVLWKIDKSFNCQICRARIPNGLLEVLQDFPMALIQRCCACGEIRCQQS